MALSRYTAMLSPEDRDYLALVAALRSSDVPVTHPAPRLPTQKSLSTHRSRLLAGWVPHPFTVEETRAARLEGLRYLIIARQIEGVQRDIYPRKLPIEVAAQLVFAKYSYLIRYFRTFRVNDLPTEIISNILRLVVWDQMQHPVDARLRITGTCRRWRGIALADSTLWNAIWFRGRGARMERAWAWFARARCAPLDIRIDAEPAGDHRESDSSVITFPNDHALSSSDIRQILPRLFTKLSTIRILIVVVNDWQNALTVLDLLATMGAATGVPALQRFELHRSGTRNEDSKLITWPTFVAQPFLGGVVAPSLDYLSLNGVPIDWTRSILENLTTFDIRCLPVEHFPDAARFREILSNCPRLQKLSLDGAGPKFEESPEKIHPVQLAYLRTLVIADFTRPYAMFLFSQFSAPGVNDLTLWNLCGDDYIPLFIQLTATFPKVRLLTAYSIQFDVSPLGVHAMTCWLESMPLLTYLRVANVTNQFFGTFFRMRAGGGSNPAVAKLAVVDFQSLDPVVVVQFVKDRHRYGLPLTKVYISEELGRRLAPEQIKTLTGLCTLAKLPRGATTPEEEKLTL